MERSYLFPAALALSLAALLPTGCARADSPAPHPPNESPSRSSMTFADVATRMVLYADSIKSLSDGNPEHFSKAVGVPLIPIEAGAKALRSGSHQLATGQLFGAQYSAIGGLDSIPIHYVNFLPSAGGSYTDDPNVECLWNAEEAGKSLEAVGFNRGANLPFQRGRMQEYGRELSEKEMVFVVSLLTYTTQSESGPQTCVYSVRYEGGAK